MEMEKILDLNTDMSNISKKQRDSYNDKISKIHDKIINRSGLGNEFMDWINWPRDYDKEEVNRINQKVQWMKDEGIETLLVIGIGWSYLGAQSAIDFIKGKIDMQDKIVFIGNDMSSVHVNQVERQIANKKWGICVISKSGTTLEPALAFRHFKKILKEKEGIEKANELIVAVTDCEKGALHNLAKKEGYEMFTVPNGIGGRFSGITPVGLFPMAFADINIIEVLKGAEKAMKDFSVLENNIAYEYAVSRVILHKNHNKDGEILTIYDFDLDMIAKWWKQLFGESEGKDGKGIMPLSAVYSRDLHSIGQIIQDGKGTFLETTLWIEEELNNIYVEKEENDLDGLNYLEGKSLHHINKQAFLGVLHAHYEGAGTPSLVITLKDKSEHSLGYLWYFFFISVTMSAYLIDVNPFNQPGVDLYKKNMVANLKNN